MNKLKFMAVQSLCVYLCVFGVFPLRLIPLPFFCTQQFAVFITHTHRNSCIVFILILNWETWYFNRLYFFFCFALYFARSLAHSSACLFSLFQNECQCFFFCVLPVSSAPRNSEVQFQTSRTHKCTATQWRRNDLVMEAK